jgi:hypothetical protein
MSRSYPYLVGNRVVVQSGEQSRRFSQVELLSRRFFQVELLGRPLFPLSGLGCQGVRV